MLRNPKHQLLDVKVNDLKSSFKLTAMDEFKDMSAVCGYLTQKILQRIMYFLKKLKHGFFLYSGSLEIDILQFRSIQ